MSQYPVSYSVDLKDIRFALFDVFHIDDLVQHDLYNHLTREKMEDFLTRGARTAVETIAPVNPIGDRNPPQYKDGKVTLAQPYHAAFKKVREEGWIPLTMKREAGGRGLPESLGSVIKEMQTGAAGGFSPYMSVTAGAANLVYLFGNEEVKRLFLEKMTKGIYTGTMCLTEPNSGSYLAEIKTQAKREGDHFLIKGTKIFIGAGDHDLAENILHCVLARMEGAPEGNKGISLFAVPKYLVNADGSLGKSNNVFCAGIENKMGHVGATTASLHFGEQGPCKGWLMGQENKGLSQMFIMMNEARLHVATQAVSQAAGAYGMALAYAKQRYQGLSPWKKKGEPATQVTIINHPDVRRNLMFMKTMVEGMRRINIQTGLYIDLSKTVQDKQQREYYEDLVEILTPICKAYAADMGFRVTETAVQIFGGRGYIKEYPAEQYLRDIKPTSIYEGANGIHAITHLSRNLNLKEGQVFRNFVAEMDNFINKNLFHPALCGAVGALKQAKDIMVAAASSFPAKKAQDPSFPLSIAKPFLDLTGHIVCTWMLLKSAVVAYSYLQKSQLSDSDLDFYKGKIYTAHFAVANLLPQVEALAKTVSLWDRSILDMPEASF